MVRLPDRLGQAVARRTRQDKLNRRFQADAVPGRDIQQPGADSGAQRCPDHLIPIQKRLPGSTLLPDYSVLTDQA